MPESSSNLIKVAHSPDSDDAFMFYAILENKIDLRGFDFEISSDEIDVLNQAAFKEEFDICAVSFHAFHYIKDNYEIMPSGASMGGADYGPRLISKDEKLLEKEKLKIAIPGKYTSAFLCLQIWFKENNPNIDLEFEFCSYNEVFNLIDTNKVDAALLIHEAQLRYKELGYKLIVDLGNWWFKSNNGWNMPLGCNVVRKSLGQETVKDLNEILYESIQWGLKNFDETLAYARKFADNKLSDDEAKKYIEMYVNKSTEKLSDDDWSSIEKLLSYKA